MGRDVFGERFGNCDTVGCFLNAFSDDPYFFCENIKQNSLTKGEMDFLVRDKRFVSLLCHFCSDADSTDHVLNAFLKKCSGDQPSILVEQEVFRVWLEKLVNSLEVKTKDGVIGVNREKQQIFSKVINFFRKTDKTFLFDPKYSFLWKRKEVALFIRDFSDIDLKKSLFDYLLEYWAPGMAHMDVIKALTYSGFTSGSPEDLQRCLKLIDKKSLLFLVSNSLLCECLKKMQIKDMRPRDYEMLLQRSYSSQLQIPEKFFNEKMITAYNIITEPIVALTILKNLERFNPWKNVLSIERSRRKYLYSKRYKTCDSVCEYFFKDTAKNTSINTGNMHTFGKKSPEYKEWLATHAGINEFKLYGDVHANIENEKVGALFLELKRRSEEVFRTMQYEDTLKTSDIDVTEFDKILKQVCEILYDDLGKAKDPSITKLVQKLEDFEFSETLYDGMAKARDLVTTEFAENVKDFRQIEGIKNTIINGVKIYELTGEDFTLLVRKKGGISSCNRKDILKYFEINEDWVMSTTLLSENSLRFFNPDAVKSSLDDVFMYGFKDIESKNISLISVGDCWTKNDFSDAPLEEDDARNPFSHYAATSVPFIRYKEFQRACLFGNLDEKRGYNEVVVVPYKRGDEGDNYCMPDCIVMFRTAREKGKPLKMIINRDVIDTAREMGLDIVVIDHEKYQTRINKKLDEIVNKMLNLESSEYSDVPDSSEVINSNINSKFKK